MEYNIDFYKHFAWLRKVNLHSAGNTESYQDRLSRLEGDKELLILQVSVLTDQVEAQGVKICDLESSLLQHQHKLNSAEEMLQQDLVHRTSLEKQKLSLMSEVSYLKVKLENMEGKQFHVTERQHKAESVVNLISELQEQMCRFQKEINSRIQEKMALEASGDRSNQVVFLHSAGSTKAQSSNLRLSCDRSPEVMHKLEELPDTADANTNILGESSPDTQQQCRCGSQSGLFKELRILKDKVEQLEDQKLQFEKKLQATKAEISSLQQLLVSKDAEIENLHVQLLVRPTQSSERDQEVQRLRSGMKSLVAANEEKDRRIEELSVLLNQCRQRELTHTMRQTPPAVRSLPNGRNPSSSSEEVELGVMMKNADATSAKSEDVKSDVSTSSSSSQQTSVSSAQKDTNYGTEPLTSSFSMNDLQNVPSQMDDDRSRVSSSVLEQNEIRDSSEIHTHPSPERGEDGESNQNKMEKIDVSTSSSENAQAGQRTVGSAEYMKNNRSIKRLWAKLRRTESGGLGGVDPEPSHSQFKRGGLRATAGPRLTRTPDSYGSIRDMKAPFSQWTKQQVCDWLEDYGLGQYVNLTRQWVENGQTLLSSTAQDFEKQMGMKNPLHRKKLQLALRAFSTKLTEKSAQLDHIWVTRWLDDIGLPQYKDQFHEARVDGRMIQYLTVNDLLTLKVTSQLHHLSVKCAIHVLHANKFNPNCLRRRPAEEKHPSPSEVVQWSNHRVMEWLRVVDLAEYAPNLRGSGVHGGLIVLEPRFSAETLALLLNIPPQKTLLRRHLASAFSALVGPQATQEKREYGNATGHVPLTTTAKVRPKKLGFTHFSHLRKRKPDDEDYIYPIDSGVLTINGVSHWPSSGLRGLNLDRQSGGREQMGVKN